jgi:hypothetical protein
LRLRSEGWTIRWEFEREWASLKDMVDEEGTLGRMGGWLVWVFASRDGGCEDDDV